MVIKSMTSSVQKWSSSVVIVPTSVFTEGIKTRYIKHLERYLGSSKYYVNDSHNPN